jgi:hypothetical protein
MRTVPCFILLLLLSLIPVPLTAQSLTAGPGR